jgi:hypothetical protein
VNHSELNIHDRLFWVNINHSSGVCPAISKIFVFFADLTRSPFVVILAALHNNDGRLFEIRALVRARMLP